MKTKKTKRIISLILALTMIFTFMAMSASAATTEIQPRGNCPRCTHGYMGDYTTPVGEPVKQAVTKCSYSNIPHVHTLQDYYSITTCSYCVYQSTITYTITDCPYK